MFRRRILASVMVLFLAACVGTEYQAPRLNVDATEARTKAIQRIAIDKRMMRRARLYDLTWPVLTSNARLCSNTRKSAGVVLADRKYLSKLVGGLTEDQLEVLGVDDALRIVHVMAGSPAAQSGLMAGDEVLAVAEEAVPESNALKKMTKIIAASLKENENISLKIKRDGQTQIFEVQGSEVCDIKVKLSTSSALNARATDDSFIMNAGLMRALDDAPLQYVIAHEIAHVALKHQNKAIRNGVTSGAVIYGPILYGAGVVADYATRLARIDRKRSFSVSAFAASVPYLHDYEAEADYVGLYMFARAGGDLTKATETFLLFATENLASTWIRYTHPLTPERIVAAEITIAEIEEKRAAGEALLPTRR